MKKITKAKFDSLVKCCEQVAKSCPDIETFNEVMEGSFPRFGEGSFRIVLDAGEFVIKIRRHESLSGNKFPMGGKGGILRSNYEERKAYTLLKKEYPYLVPFVVEPHFIRLSNDHNVVIMERVVQLGDHLDMGVDEDGCFGMPDLDDMSDTIIAGYQFITETFSDGHMNNLGVNSDGLVVMLDFNCADTYCDCADADVIADAHRVYEKVTGKSLPLPKSGLKFAKVVA